MAEGAPLLREYTLIGIEGSNPSLSAIHKKAQPKRWAFLCMAERDDVVRSLRSTKLFGTILGVGSADGRSPSAMEGASPSQTCFHSFPG